MESCACSFSARSRPCRNSFFAASDDVVTGIFPPAGDAAGLAESWPAYAPTPNEETAMAMATAPARTEKPFGFIVSLLGTGMSLAALWWQFERSDRDAVAESTAQAVVTTAHESQK